MLNVFICDDNKSHVRQISKIVENFIIIENFDMKIVLATDEPNSIIEYLTINKGSGLYFLDVKMQHENEGLILAEKIRKYDPRAFIVFISSFPEKALLTFKYKVEAMEFISKSDFADVAKKITECIINAHEKYTAKLSELQRVFTYKLYDQIITTECSKIIYFETSPTAKRKVIMHLVNGISEFYGTLNDIEKSLDGKFYRCHQSYIINFEHIRSIDVTKRLIFLSNDNVCPVSARNLQIIKKKLLE